MAFTMGVWAATEEELLRALLALRGNLFSLQGSGGRAVLVFLDARGPARTQDGAELWQDLSGRSST